MTEAGGISWHRDADGVVLLTLDSPGRPVNLLDAPFRAALRAALDRLEEERDSIAAVVITSAKESFCAGADLTELAQARAAGAQRVTAGISETSAQLRRLELLGKPVAAAVNGSAAGAGFALALACHYRVAARLPGAVLGFPEAALGLLPGVGGLVRTVRLLGVDRALAEVLLDGVMMTPAQAAGLGLVDELVNTPALAVERAKDWVKANPEGCAQPWDKPGYRVPGGTPAVPSFAAILPVLAAKTRERFAGAPAAAARAILAAAVESTQVDLAAACLVETRYLASLLLSPTAANQTAVVFFDRRSAGGAADLPPWITRQAAVGACAARIAASLADGEGPEAFARRLVGAYVAEAAAAVGEGAEPASVEQAGAQAGCAAPPLRLLDEITLPHGRALVPRPHGTAVGRARERSGGQPGAPSPGEAGGRARPHPAGPVLDRMAGELGRGGRSLGGGFYSYADDGTPERLWPGVREAFASGSSRAELAALQERMLFAQALEAVRCLEDGVVRSAAEANAQSVCAAGFPAWTGGAIRYVNAHPGGARGFAARAGELARRHGEHFQPPPSLVAAAAAGGEIG